MLISEEYGGTRQQTRVILTALLIAIPLAATWFYLYPAAPVVDYRHITMDIVYSVATLVVLSMVWGLNLKILQLGGGLFLLGVYINALDDFVLVPDYIDIYVCQGLQLVGVTLFVWSTYYYHSQLTRKLSWLRKDLAQMRFRATHDSLTNLPNRVLFQDRLVQALAGAQRRNQQLALLYIDLDNMKEVNDTLGHAMGDNLLNEIAQRLRSSVRDSDTIARLGGDEFVIIQTDVNDHEDAMNMAIKLLDAIQMPVNCDGETIHPSASVGISLYPEDAGTGDDLLDKADAAMYRAKQLDSPPRIIINND